MGKKRTPKKLDADVDTNLDPIGADGGGSGVDRDAPSIPAGMVEVTLVGGPFAGERRIVPEGFDRSLMEGGEHGPGYVYAVDTAKREAVYQTSAAETAGIVIDQEVAVAEAAGAQTVIDATSAEPDLGGGVSEVGAVAPETRATPVGGAATTLEAAVKERFGRTFGKRSGALDRIVDFYEPHREQIEANPKAAWGALPYPPDEVTKAEA